MSLVEPKLLEVDAHDQVGVERLAHGGVVDPGVLVDPAGHLLLVDHLRLADVALEEAAHGGGQFAGRSGVAEFEFDDWLADHGHVLPLEPLELRRRVLRHEDVGRGEERGTTGAGDEQRRSEQAEAGRKAVQGGHARVPRDLGIGTARRRWPPADSGRGG
jgi:hypothetical protein